MKPETADGAILADTLNAIRQELTLLSERVAALEASSNSARGTRNAERKTKSELRTPSSEPRVDEGISEELIVVLSAAVAAYLGKKPRIQQIRLIGTTAWAQQGRVTIQASHALATRQTRREH